MLRRNLIIGSLLCLLCSLVGSGLAGAHIVKHHHKKHLSSALPYMGAIPAPSIFGIDTYTYDRSKTNWLRDTPTARSLGAHWIHYTAGDIHFSGNGAPNWSTMDYAITRARKYHLGVLISLGGTPRACSKRPSTFSGCPPTTSAELSAYKSFLRAELVRYRNVVHVFESWVEPNTKSSWLGGANPRQYANLLKVQYQVMQSVNRAYHTHLELLFAAPMMFSPAPGSQPGSMAWVPFVREVLSDLGGARAFDAVALHAYRFPEYPNESARDENWGPNVAGPDYVGNMTFPDEGCAKTYSGWCSMTWSNELRTYEVLFEQAGYGQQSLWLTEFGWPGNAHPSTALYPSFATQAQYLREAYADLLRLPFVKAAFWFNQRDYQPGMPNPDAPYFAHYGLLKYHFAKKPAGVAFKKLARRNRGR